MNMLYSFLFSSYFARRQERDGQLLLFDSSFIPHHLTFNVVYETQKIRNVGSERIFPEHLFFNESMSIFKILS